MEQGPVERRIIETCMREGLPLPDKIQNAPELDYGMELFIQAFFDLSTSRPIGLDQGPIPWTAIDTYCQRLEIEDEQRDDMFYHIRALDSVYLDFSHKSSKSGSK